MPKLFSSYDDHDQLKALDHNENDWKRIYYFGGISSIISLALILFDIIVGTVSGANLNAMPQTALDRYDQFQQTLFSVFIILIF